MNIVTRYVRLANAFVAKYVFLRLLLASILVISQTEGCFRRRVRPPPLDEPSSLQSVGSESGLVAPADYQQIPFPPDPEERNILRVIQIVDGELIVDLPTICI